MRLDKVLEKIGVPRLVNLSPAERLEATKKWRGKREETLSRLREAGTTKKGRRKKTK